MGQVKNKLAEKIEYLSEQLSQNINISKDDAHDYLWDEWAEKDFTIEALDSLVEELINGES